MISEGAAALRAESRRAMRRSFIVMAILAVVLFIATIYGVSVHQYKISFAEAYQIILDRILGNPIGDTYEDWFKDHLVINMNMPRALSAIAIGIILAVCGAVMQSVVKNPLADPYVTGISSGALLGVTVYLALGISILPGLHDSYALIFNAFLCALIPTGFIVIVTVFKKNMSGGMMILAGLGIMYLFSSFSSLIRYQADPADAHAIFHWTLGMLGRANWDTIWILVVAAVVTVIFGILISRTLNAMTAGDNFAKTLGVNVRIFRSICLVFIALMTATAVAFSGTIGFIGLVCPHITRVFVGPNNRYVVPISAVVGATVLMVSDIVSRVITATGLPVGAVTSLIGAPIFMYLLIKSKNNW